MYGTQSDMEIHVSGILTFTSGSENPRLRSLSTYTRESSWPQEDCAGLVNHAENASLAASKIASSNKSLPRNSTISSGLQHFDGTAERNDKANHGFPPV
jgi:hypothetical protein